MGDLQGSRRDLEGQLNESKRMLELRNTELADLQAKLAASQQAPSLPRSRRRRRPSNRLRPSRPRR